MTHDSSRQHILLGWIRRMRFTIPQALLMGLDVANCCDPGIPKRF
ncbi:MAG: hypothetical protein AB4290_30320 [Spirulina sp.]